MRQFFIKSFVRPSGQTFFYTLIFLTVLGIPFLILISDWQWNPVTVPPFLLLTSVWVSESIPIVGMFFIILALFLLRLNYRQNVLLIVCIIATLILGAGLKTLLKDVWQEPRPYVVWLETQTGITPLDFYALPDKSLFVSELDLSQTPIADWQQIYWAKSTGYSFPSGHSLFAVQILLIVMTILWRKKAHAVIVLVAGWSIAVLASRLFLGMHWPQDLIVSCLLAFLLAIPFFLILCRQTFQLTK